MNIAFLGLGAMGQRMVARLVAAGHQVTVWNRSAGPTPAGSQRAASPAEAARGAALVFSMVFDDAASRRVWLAEDGAAQALAPEALAVECSTLSPAWVAELGAALPVPLVDAPLAGSRPQAEAGQLIFLLGATPDQTERLRPVLLALGSAVHRVGPAGSGAWLKLAVNSLFATQVVAVAEQLALLRGAGLDLDAALPALKSLPVMSASSLGALALMQAGQHPPMAPVDLIAKDLDYALAASAHPLPLTAAVRQRFADTQAAGLGALNLTAVRRLYR